MLSTAPRRKLRKLEIDLDKQAWHPSVLPGQVVLVSTVDPDGLPNVAPKSWITMAAFHGPMLAFGCNVTHATCQNVLATGAFVVNVPDASLAERIWAMPGTHNAERIRHSGFTLRPSSQVAAPLVEECRAHLECELDDIKYYGDEVVIFGNVVALSIDEDCLAGEPTDQYFALSPLFFLEDGTYGVIDAARVVGRPWPVEQGSLFAVQLGEFPFAGDRAALVDSHVAFLQTLRAGGKLLLAGPFDEGDVADGILGGGLYVVREPSRAAAEALAREDPLVRAGAPCAVRAWTRTF
ncbi:MAG TPA: flavin reductase [Thermomicrobiaceae bacterium]|nr:flavin reductase [Thermomicrobiaceae bacterium]